MFLLKRLFIYLRQASLQPSKLKNAFPGPGHPVNSTHLGGFGSYFHKGIRTLQLGIILLSKHLFSGSRLKLEVINNVYERLFTTYQKQFALPGLQELPTIQTVYP